MTGVKQDRKRRTYAWAAMEVLEPRVMMDGSDLYLGNAASLVNSSPAVSLADASSDDWPDDTNTLDPPSTPKQVTAQAISGSSVYISWKKADGADGYWLWRAGPDGQWEAIIKLKGHGTTNYLDTGLTPGTIYSYMVRAYNDAGNSSYSQVAGVATVDTDDPTFVGQFGRLTLGSNVSAPLTTRDADGTLVTFTLNGPGIGVLHLEDGKYSLEITGTTTSSKLVITTVKGGPPGDDGRFQLDGLTIGNTSESGDITSLGKLTAKTTDLTGSLTITGTAGILTLGNLLGDNVLTIDAGGGMQSAPGLKLSVGQVNQATINSGIGIASLVAIQWGGGAIIAPYLNSLNVTGRTDKTGSVAGDFGANLLLSGVGVGARKSTLGNVKIAGTLGGTWEIDGTVSSIRAKSAATFALTVNDAGGTVLGNVKSLMLSDATATSENLAIHANAIASVNVLGNLSGADIHLRQGVGRTQALGRLTIRGQLIGSEIWSQGNIGSVRIGVMDHSRILAGVMDGVVGLPTSTSDFVSGDVQGVGGLPTIGSVVVTGTSAAKDAPVWINATVAAGSIGKVTLPNRETAVLDADLLAQFGFATVGGVKKYAGPVSGGNYVSGEDSVVS
ncbi:MAG: fibronectin type III domain-containing protein [Phycisphaerales bacterium]|nr:fibronectin type III domain-containing protein [Phycisphaerales bacterium]